MIAKDSPHTRLFAAVFEGLAQVEFVDPTTLLQKTPETDELRCYSQRVLAAHGVTDSSAIPVVALTPDEKDWARDFLKDYDRPIAFNPTTASARPELPEWDMRNYRRMPSRLTTDILAQLRGTGRTILRFGCRKTQTHIYSNYEAFEGVVDLCDLTIRQVAACYHQIGQYVGTDSGDMHLSLAVGASCYAFVPPSVGVYHHPRQLYTAEDFAGEPVRIQYAVFDHPTP